MHVIGIDISKLKFDVCCLFEGKKMTRVFKNNEEGFKELLEWIEPLKLDNPHFCMEATGCYSEGLAEFLHESKMKVSVINPLQIKRFKDSKLVRQKTDKTDACIIAEFCLQNKPSLWVSNPLEIKELRDVHKHISNLKEELNRWTNRLEKERRNSLVALGIQSKIETLEKEIKDFEKEALRIIKSSEDLSQKYEILTGVKGIGPRLAITILCEMPDVKNFQKAKQYAAFTGVTPSHFRSGTSVNGRSHISRIGSRHIRKVLYMAALVVKNKNKDFRKWVETLENKGKTAKVIIVAVMRKLMYLIFGMLKNNQNFDVKKAFANA